jgi:hypothetical protein
MEFALVYGNDWFSVPIPVPLGDLSRVMTLVVTDTSGVRTVIRPVGGHDRYPVVSHAADDADHAAFRW